MLVACSRGKFDLCPGQEFTMYSGDRYRVERFTGQGIYSPSGLGGTAIVECRYIGGSAPPEQHEQYFHDGLIDFCSDSVAAICIEAQP